MSREIKFRFWDCYTGKMTGWDGAKDEYELNDAFNMVSIKPMQYTGLKDRNGVEIYEGDVVQSDWYGDDMKCQALIKWDEEEAGFGFFNPRNGDLSGEQDAFKYGMPTCFTVIGNIHQNPELLK